MRLLRRIARNSLRRRSVLRERSAHFAAVTLSIRQRYRDGKRIRVGFFVLYDSAFPALSIARSLVNDERFEPVIVLIPDTLRGHDNMVAQLTKSARSLDGLGIRLVWGYDLESQSFNDVSGELDFICISNPYDELTHELFTIAHLRDKDVLPFFISYGFSLSRFHLTVIQRESFQGFWRLFVPTRLNQKDYRKHANVLPGAVEVTGYCKMDGLARTKGSLSPRPVVIIAPHHTVRAQTGGLELSTFLTYADTIRELPRTYPGIDFVFRPHPLLFVHLQAEDLWGPSRCADYLTDLGSLPNVVVDTADDYLETFARSSALIHDSGSFSAEYLFTGSPALFLATSVRDPALQFGRLGNECLKHHYRATSIAQISQFIEGVVIRGNDPLKPGRQRFVNSTLMVHYPHAGAQVVQRLATVLEERA